MEQVKTYKIHFEEVNAAQANQYAAQLREAILESSPEVDAKIVKDSSITQDFGATIVLILGAPAVVIVAKGIADYLRRSRGTITIKTDDETVIATGLTGQDAARIAEAFASPPKER